jgi:hypothetical protein
MLPIEGCQRPWVDEAAPDRITPELSPKHRADVFRYTNSCLRKRVSCGWFLATSRETVELMAHRRELQSKGFFSFQGRDLPPMSPKSENTKSESALYILTVVDDLIAQLGAHTDLDPVVAEL